MTESRGVCPVHGPQVGYWFRCGGYGPRHLQLLLCSVLSRDGGTCNQPLKPPEASC